MSDLSARWKVLVVTLPLLLLGLLWLNRNYPLTYIYRVLAFQDADYDDIHRFPASRIAPAEEPGPLPSTADPRAVGVIEQHPDVSSLDTLIRETRTTAFLVVHAGSLVVERYGEGDTRESLQNSFSVSKAITSALVGLAVRDGVLAPEDPITRFLPELEARDERFADITVEHLLDMRSGVRYESGVQFPFVTADDPLAYYFPDLESLLLERSEIEMAPGTFEYNHYNPPLLGLILRRATGLTPSALLERELWKPMGAASAAGWSTDDLGFERMESGFHATARDLARFGMLYLNDGRAPNGTRQILEEAWVWDSTVLRDTMEVESFDGQRWWYRNGWWVIPRPTGRPDYCGIGRFGQFICVSPQHDVVFVRDGPDRGDWGDADWTELFYFVAERLSEPN